MKNKKPLNSQALLELNFLADPQFTSDGKILCVKTNIISSKSSKADKDKAPAYKSELLLLEGTKEKQLTHTPDGDWGLGSSHTPTPNPTNSTVAFLSNRNSTKEKKENAIYLLDLNGGEAKRISRPGLQIREFVWHPNGKELAIIHQEVEEENTDVCREITNISYRFENVGFLPKATYKIALLNVQTGRDKDIKGLELAPSSLVFSPDGSKLYYAAAKSLENQNTWQTALWSLDVKTKRSSCIVEERTRLDSIAPSPDGQQLAFVASADGNGFASTPSLWLCSTKASKTNVPVCVTKDIDVGQSCGGDSRMGSHPNPLIWQEDGKGIYFINNQNGRSCISRLDVETKSVSSAHPTDAPVDRAVISYAYANGQFSFIAETPHSPGELYSLASDKEKQLTKVNQKFVQRYGLGVQSDEHTVKAKAGSANIPYWIMSPPTAGQTRKDKALVVQVHGGPHTNYGYGFYFEFHLLAAKGYTVVFGNPRGGSSYGEDFRTHLLGAYGKDDASDVMDILSDAQKTLKRTKAPVHLTGGSYGGFMTNWLIGQKELVKTFRSAVTQRSISNFVSFFGTSDIGFNFSPVQQGGNMWDDTQKLWNQSPMKYVQNIETPLLIIHSEQDYRCPMEQAEQLFTAMKVLNKAECEFIRFPGEGHELSRSGRPDRRIKRLDAMVGWFENHA